jgi:DnaK suppressor protein
MTPLPPEQLMDLRARLEARARALYEDIRAAAEDRARAGPLRPQDTVEDLGEQGERRSHDAVRYAGQNRDVAELQQIGAALARMDEGRYGECVDCGLDIPLPRLQVQPAAGRCVNCQQRHEKMHSLTSAAVPSS